MLRFRVGNKQQQQQYNVTTFELKQSFIAMMLPVVSKQGSKPQDKSLLYIQTVVLDGL